MTRVCFTMRLHPDLVDEYVERHRAVPPEMLREIVAAGRRNYSIHLGPDGLLVGYYETDDDAAAQRYLAASPIATAWEAESARFFADLGGGRADQSAQVLTEVFDLADQLAAADADPERESH
jgi:L-rhamnose mutarotase